MKNNKGWIKIAEAFVAIMLLIGILLIMISSKNVSFNKGERFYNKEAEILGGLQVNKTLRNEVLTSTLPINSTNPLFSSEINGFLESEVPLGMNCTLNLCATNTSCNLEIEVDGPVYVNEVLITGDNTIYSPRIARLFCY